MLRRIEYGWFTLEENFRARIDRMTIFTGQQNSEVSAKAYNLCERSMWVANMCQCAKTKGRSWPACLNP